MPAKLAEKIRNAGTSKTSIFRRRNRRCSKRDLVVCRSDGNVRQRRRILLMVTSVRKDSTKSSWQPRTSAFPFRPTLCSNSHHGGRRNVTPSRRLNRWSARNHWGHAATRSLRVIPWTTAADFLSHLIWRLQRQLTTGHDQPEARRERLGTAAPHGSGRLGFRPMRGDRIHQRRRQTLIGLKPRSLRRDLIPLHREGGTPDSITEVRMPQIRSASRLR